MGPQLFPTPAFFKKLLEPLRKVWSGRWTRLCVPLGKKILNAKRLRQRLPRIESLKLKLTLGSTAVAVGILVITYSTLSSKAREAASSQAQKRAGELLSYFSESIAESMAQGDRMQVHIHAQAMLNNGVHAISVTTSDGKVLFAPKPELQDNSLYSAQEVTSDANGIVGTVDVNGKTFIHTAKAIQFGDRPAGVAHLWLERSELEQRIQKAHAFIYPIFVTGFVLMFFLSIAVLNSPFRALKRLTFEAQRIGQGDLSVRVPVDGEDEVARFCQAFNSMVDGLCQARAEVTRKHLETIKAMISAVEAKDSYTQGHCVRVRHYTRQILKNMPESSRLKEDIETAALLHDIGKIGIPEHILSKDDRLDPAEVEVIRTHVTIGANILLHLDSMKEIARWIRHHHERWDGMGYPNGLRGDAIPLSSRVIAVADCMDAMLTDRPYRAALSREEAVQRLIEGKSRQFDPQIVDYAVLVLKKDEPVEEFAEA